MLNDMIQERSKVETDLLKKEAELLCMQEELTALQDKQKLGSMIDEYLAAHYSELQRKHPIDRTLEKEVAGVIKEKEAAIAQAEKALRKVKKESMLNTANKEYVAELKRIFGELDVDIKRLYKKAISKIDLNAMIGMMDYICETGSEKGTIPLSYRQKVYKWQLIAKEYPEDDERIDKEEEDEARKALKGELAKNRRLVTALKKEIELIERENESANKKTKNLEDLMTSIEQQYNEKEQTIVENAAKRTADAEELLKSDSEKIRVTFSNNQKANEDKKERLNLEISDIQREIQRLSAELNEINRKLEAIVEEYQGRVSIARKSLEESERELNRLKNEKESVNIALIKPFVLPFKARKLKDKIAELDLLIIQAEKTFQERKMILVGISNENPDINIVHPLKQKEAEINSAIKELSTTLDKRKAELTGLNCPDLFRELEDQLEQCKQEFDTTIMQIEADRQDRLKKLEQEKEETAKKIKNQKSLTNKNRKNLNSKKKELKEAETIVDKKEQDLRDVHTEYIISKYGKQFVKDKTVQNKARIKMLSDDIKTLKKDLSALNKKITELEKKQKREQEEQRKLLVKKTKEEEQKRKEQEQRQQQIKKELLERDSEQKLINNKSDVSNKIEKIVNALEKNPEHDLFKMDTCPLLDDNKRIITNSIVRKQYTQMIDTPDCNCYLLVFVDPVGNMISEMRLIEKKAIGEMTKTSFELHADNGFGKDHYYLLFLDFDKGDCICAQKYVIKIAFSNDFGF